MLVDKNTLLVHYRDESRVCIECKKCVRICHMGIDIRTSPFQMECIHCGECIDACEDVLRRIGKPGLIHYVWGEKGEVAGDRSMSWHRRLGLRDAKRVVVMLVILFYLSGLLVALSLREPVLVRVSPDRATSLYATTSSGVVTNHFRLRLANRGSRQAFVVIGTLGLPGGRAKLDPNPVSLQAGQELNLAFDIEAAPWPGAQEVNHFKITARSSPGESVEEIPMTFLMPPTRVSK
jgi:polyferredoxin